MNIIQAPKHLKLEDLPHKLKINEPFKIDGVEYVLTQSNFPRLEVCQEEAEGKTNVPEESEGYYIIRRNE